MREGTAVKVKNWQEIAKMAVKQAASETTPATSVLLLSLVKKGK